MAKLPVEILDLRLHATADLTQAIAEADRVQPEFTFRSLGPEYVDALRLHVLQNTHSGTFFDALAKKKTEWRGFHPFIVAFIDTALHSDRLANLFGTRRGEEGLAVVTSFGVEETIVPKGRMAAYYLYELASHSLAFVVSGKEHHRQNRRCIFDLKEDKRQLLESMKGGALCDECRIWFIENGTALSPAQLSAVDTLLRHSAALLNRPADESARSRPRIFVGSSVEGLRIARAIQSDLQYDYFVEIWNQNTVFGLGTATIEALEKAAKTYDYGVFVFSPDDEVESRRERKSVPRDNVIFEAGLFIGSLSRFRAFIVAPRGVDIQLPTDLKGLTIATYDPEGVSLDAAIGPACHQIRTAIDRDMTQ